MIDRFFMGRAVAALMLSMGLAPASHAQFVPGTDPVVLQSAVSVEMLPLTQAKSKSLDSTGDLPAWLNAKVVRYEAKAVSADKGSVTTDSDVITTTAVQNGRRTCVQEVGSRTASASGSAGIGGRYGPGNGGDQIVVLRGDLINAC